MRAQKEISSEIDTRQELCPAMGDYELIHHGSDARSGLNIIYNGHSVDLYRQITHEYSPGAFPNVRQGRTEWRYTGSGTAPVYFALIFRVDATDPVSSAAGSVSRLFVVALKGESTCLVGVTKNNMEARALADRLLNETLPCF